MVEEYKEAEVSYVLLARLLDQAFITPPLPFNPAWLVYTDPPEIVYQDYLSTSYETAKEMLLYQIADLHRLQEAGILNDKWVYMGIQSPTKHTWYNFDPGTFLECASAGLEDVYGQEIEITKCSWGDLVFLLWLGQVYE